MKVTDPRSQDKQHPLQPSYCRTHFPGPAPGEGEVRRWWARGVLHTEGLDCAETQTTSRGHHVKPALRTVWGVRCIRSEGDVKPEFREEGLVRPETKCVFRRAARISLCWILPEGGAQTSEKHTLFSAPESTDIPRNWAVCTTATGSYWGVFGLVESQAIPCQNCPVLVSAVG